MTKLIEHKRKKMRTMNAVISSKVQSSRSPQATVLSSRRVVGSAKSKAVAGQTQARLSSQPDHHKTTAMQSRISPRAARPVPTEVSKQPSEAKTSNPSTAHGSH